MKKACVHFNISYKDIEVHTTKFMKALIRKLIFFTKIPFSEPRVEHIAFQKVEHHSKMKVGVKL